MEKFVPVYGYEGFYEISDLGRVKSIDRIVDHSVIGKKRIRSRFMYLKKNSHGYFDVQLSKNGVSKTYPVHRLVMKSFYGDSDLFVDHINGIRDDNNLSNLEYVSHRENCIRGVSMKKLRCDIGITKLKSGYVVSKSFNNKKMRSEVFKTKDEAIYCYNNFDEDYFLKIAKSRKPPFFKWAFKSKKKWRSRIVIDGKKYSLGYYDTPEEAHQVAKEFKESQRG